MAPRQPQLRAAVNPFSSRPAGATLRRRGGTASLDVGFGSVQRSSGAQESSRRDLARIEPTQTAKLSNENPENIVRVTVVVNCYYRQSQCQNL
jgi:hypothetical protein